MSDKKTEWEKFRQSGKISDYIAYRRYLMSETGTEVGDSLLPEEKNEPEHRRTCNKRECNGRE